MDWLTCRVLLLLIICMYKCACTDMHLNTWEMKQGCSFSPWVNWVVQIGNDWVEASGLKSKGCLKHGNKVCNIFQLSTNYCRSSNLPNRFMFNLTTFELSEPFVN